MRISERRTFWAGRRGGEEITKSGCSLKWALAVYLSVWGVVGKVGAVLMVSVGCWGDIAVGEW